MVRVAVPGGGPYTATKAAVESLLRSMSKELAPRKGRITDLRSGDAGRTIVTTPEGTQQTYDQSGHLTLLDAR